MNVFKRNKDYVKTSNPGNAFLPDFFWNSIPVRIFSCPKQCYFV